MPQDTNPIQHMADALAAHDRACRALFDRMDYAIEYMAVASIPTKVLMALDYCRATAAELFPYVSGPFIKDEPEPQATDGPTQDQEPSRFTQHMAEALREYDNGFLTTGEMSAVLRAMLEDEETSQATREAADNGEQPTLQEHILSLVDTTVTATPGLTVNFIDLSTK